MTTHWGATPEDWASWDLFVGVGRDLLPVVCQPGLTIAPTSSLTSYGKVPSRFDREGRVVGFPQWTQHVASDAEIAKWSGDSRLGICLQTKQLRALDVDVPDRLLAIEILAFLLDRFGKNLAYRWRKDSNKFLCLFWLDGEYGKQTLETDHGVIEWLANGQQALVCGTHKDGARYEWAAGEFPRLDAFDFEVLQSELAWEFASLGETWSVGRSSAGRDAGVVTEAAAEDDVARYLVEKGLSLRTTADRIDVVCPWQSAHTAGTDPTATSYFLAGTGGFSTGNFRCLHSHCHERSTHDFLNAIGYYEDGFVGRAPEPVVDLAIWWPDADDDIMGWEKPAVPVAANPLTEPRFIRNTQTGMIKVLVKNVVEALRHPHWCDMLVRYDTFRNVIVLGPQDDCRPIQTIDSTGLNILLSERNFGPGAISNDMIERGLLFAAHERAFDSGIEWLQGLVWDGIPRIEQFCTHYLGSEDTPYHRAVSRYWWTAHAGRVLRPRGVQADAAVILVSTQGTGKTQLLMNISPKPEHYGAIGLSGDHYNRIREMKGRLVIELAELQGLKSRDAESIKAIISAMGDTFVDKWEKHAQDVVRRCVFVGSSNDDGFLSDPTGNRRFLPVYVGVHQHLDAVRRDRDQLWAEGASLFTRLGEVDWREAQALVLAEHCKFEEIDVWEERVCEWLDDPKSWIVGALKYHFVTCSHALSEALHMETQRQSARDMHRIVRIFVRYGLTKRQHRVSGRQTKVWVRKETNELDSGALVL